MSGKKKRMRETVIEDVGSGQECENSTRNCDDLIGLLQLIKKNQEEEEENAKGAALEKHQKMDTVKQSDEVVVTVSDTADATEVQGAKTPQRKKNKKRNKSKKKGELASSPIVILSDSQTEVQNNIVSTDSSDSDVQSRLNTENTEPVSQRKKKQKRKSDNTLNGQVEEENDVIILSDQPAVDLLQATPSVIDLTSEDNTLEDPSSLEPYSKNEISMAQASMDLEMTQGQLRWFLHRLKIRNTSARFVPRTSVMENEYAHLEDNFPMPYSD